ncbi:MAG: histidine ammonia-lyase [Bacteroidota bacterium]|nr:histidine ammonia-lyase [Bacteroidota bacterium]
MKNKYFIINKSLTPEDIHKIVEENLQLKLVPEAVKRIKHCRAYLDKKIADKEATFYGINTGFGSLCNTKISDNDLSTLQENLLRSHACGTGDMVPQAIVKLMLLLKIQSLAFGHSGVQLLTVERLIYFFNYDILPVVFEQGSLGASGDLAPLAHLSLPLLGEGKVFVKKGNSYEIKDSESVLVQHKLKPVKLQSKEGLALINGTQFMSAYGVYILLQSTRLSDWANTIAAISLDGFDGRLEPFNKILHEIRPHAGQVETAKFIRKILKDSEIAVQKKVQVQDPYAFRCIPQVHGASLDTINYCKKVVSTEINSVTDNPNIFPESDEIISGGNFHGQPLALILDFLAIALAELGSISERRTYQLISGQRNLPPFLTKNPGLNSGFMIPQYTAASIVSQNKQLCTPASVDSIVSSNGQEDHVSMGANAATKCLKVLNNLERILAIEFMNAAQAIEFRRPLKSSSVIEVILKAYRKKVKALENDRVLHDDIMSSIEFLKNYKIN